MSSMLRRCNNWDYRQRGIYMITLTVEGRVPVLGRLVGGESAAAVVPTAAVRDCGDVLARDSRALSRRYADGVPGNAGPLPRHCVCAGTAG